MNISTYINETIQQSQDYLDDEYLLSLGLKKPTKLVFARAKDTFVKVSRKIYRNFPNETPPELILNEDGSMIISWHDSEFGKKYVCRVYEVVEEDISRLRIEVTKNIEL